MVELQSSTSCTAYNSVKAEKSFLKLKERWDLNSCQTLKQTSKYSGISAIAFCVLWISSKMLTPIKDHNFPCCFHTNFKISYYKWNYNSFTRGP